MKSKIEIINGNAQIVLTPENDFEKRLIEDAHGYTLKASVFKESERFTYNEFKNHRITIKCEKKKAETKPIASIIDGPATVG